MSFFPSGIVISNTPSLKIESILREGIRTWGHPPGPHTSMSPKKCPEYSDSITSDRAYYELLVKEKTCKSYNKEATE